MSALTDTSPPGTLWSRVNAAEALPGVMTPITWSFYGKTMETNLRIGWYELGLIPEAATVYPASMEERLVATFYGRLTVSVDVMRKLMGGLPGVSGDDIERDMLGSVRPGIADDPYPGRLPHILARAPRTFLRAGRRTEAMRADNFAWWQRSVSPGGVRPGIDAAALLREALERFGLASRVQAQNRMLFGAAAGQLTAVAEAAGQPQAVGSLLSGNARTEEARVAEDLHAVAHGRLDMASFIAQHGFHSTQSGELSSRSWREDDSGLQKLLAHIAGGDAPAERSRRAAAEARQVTERLLAGLSPVGRARAKLLLRMAPATARTLEASKMSFLLTNDCGRAAVRALGAQLVAADRLDEPADAFHLFSEELLDPGTQDLRALVAERQAERAEALEVDVPEGWTGTPEVTPRAAAADERAETVVVTGIGGSPGVAEGRALVILDAADDIDVEPGDVLVCPTTDPSWLALMTVAEALVIDIGAAASHGAIVARELGLPCVIGTRTGTKDLRTGDRVRVDGSAGEVTVLEPVAS